MSNPLTILFIGGTGNISTECAALLHQRGHRIQILSRGQLGVPSEYRAIVADRKSPEAMRAALNGARPDVVINFLGYEMPEMQLDFNLFNKQLRQYIFISSATVYAKPPRSIPITEEAPLGNAFWDYAQKKLVCEQYLLDRAAEDKFPVTIVRPSHTYSKLWIANPVSSAGYSFAARLEQSKPVFVPDDGENPWTLTASSDFAVGLAGLIGKPEAVGQAFHITSDEVLTWNQIYAEIADALGVESPQIVQVPTDFICEIVPQLTGNLKGDKSHPGVFDNSKIKRFVPDFVCRKSFREGSRESVNWMRAHPEEKNLNPQVDAMIDPVIEAWKMRKS
jgi:nucleoside-diphosphate-sugar epimerase